MRDNVAGAQMTVRHDLSPDEIDAIEERLYVHNAAAAGRDDAQAIGFVLRDDGGRMIGAAAGYSWAGVAELRQLWIDDGHRGRGHGRALLEAFVAEAVHRRVHKVWVASYDFQAPGFYEQAGFVRKAELAGWPEGQVNVILCLTLVSGQ